MAITALSIRSSNGRDNFKFMTVQEKHRLVVDIFRCTEDFIPYGEPSRQESDLSEYKFHFQLREEAIKFNQFIKEESTILEKELTWKQLLKNKTMSLLNKMRYSKKQNKKESC